MKQTHTEAISLGYIYNKSMNLVGKENENKKMNKKKQCGDVQKSSVSQQLNGSRYNL